MEQRSSFCGSRLDAQPFHILAKGSLALSHILGNHPYFHVTISSTERGKFPRVCTFPPRPAWHSTRFPGEDSSARPLTSAPPCIVRGALPTFQGLRFQSQLCLCLRSLTWRFSPLGLTCSDCDMCPAMAWALRGKSTKEYKRKVKRSIPPGAHSQLGTLRSSYLENLGQVTSVGGAPLNWGERCESILEEDQEREEPRVTSAWPESGSLEPADSPL